VLGRLNFQHLSLTPNFFIFCPSLPRYLGILTCVAIGIGPTDSVLWIIVAYIPFRGGKQEGEGGVEAKLRAWYFKSRSPKMDSGEEKAASKSKRKFDAISWIWGILIPDRVARLALNRSHVGVIMTGGGPKPEAMRLYTNLAERFKRRQSEYSTLGMMRDDLVGPHMIVHVFTSLPNQVMRAGGSPEARSVWPSACLREFSLRADPRNGEQEAKEISR
jgi:hypothetical protein